LRGGEPAPVIDVGDLVGDMEGLVSNDLRAGSGMP